MKNIVEKEIELENKINETKKIMEDIRLNNKKNNKNDYLKNYSLGFTMPFEEIILEIDYINILNVEDYVYNHIILKFSDLIINYNDIIVKELYLKLKKIKEYFDYEFKELMTKKNIRGKLLLKQFINICREYSFESYIFEQYEEYLKKTNCYDNNNFDFLEKICKVLINLIENIIPDIYFI